MKLFLFIKRIFTWWDGPTIGTRLYSLRKGHKVGTDQMGNIYYKTLTPSLRDERRWVIYNGYNEASKVPAKWHIWLHKMVDTVPSEDTDNKKPFEKDHKPNLTGSMQAYTPHGSLSRKGKPSRRAATGDYQSWTPPA